MCSLLLASFKLNTPFEQVSIVGESTCMRNDRLPFFKNLLG